MDRGEAYAISSFQGACTSLMRLLFNATREAGECLQQGVLTVADQIAQVRGGLAVMQNLGTAGVSVPPQCADLHRQVIALFEAGLAMLDAAEAGDVATSQALAASYREELHIVQVAVGQLGERSRAP